MNSSPTRDTSFLNADEASAIETAVRTAVMSILKVFCDVSEKRSHCYEAKLAEAQRENAALRFRLKAAERELQTLRHISPSDYKISAEVSLSTHDFSTDVSEERGEEAACFQSDASLVIKEEPSYESTLCLKTETAEETFAAECDYPVKDNVQMCQQQSPAAEMWNMQHLQTFSSARSSLNQTREKWMSGDVLLGKLKSRECVRRYRERIRADPEKYHAWKEKERLRYQQKRKTINDLSEPMKKLKRKAWREAKRRDRARKQVQAAATHMIQTTNS
ncbi:uncharacterized protein LOC113533074 isoform X2 [Pangasianodon hypophthalmus]|uniref:uncharacterized protein LOC113533074 isoform X2 n=1 Tax=Pangasianodon hypophthalmus TaxID=310915 RepID=UPI0023073E31|nr:uncharacterized protein LOC113533074 isoform X2 [Pangasianodon hypophthalmus]